MGFRKTFFIAAALQSFLAMQAVAGSCCNDTDFDQDIGYYNITVNGTTIEDIALATNRGLCDIGRQNLMADVTIVPNVGQTILVPPEVCNPDSTTCLIPPHNRTRDCVYGGPRLYYTVNGDTYDKIGIRLNVTTESLYQETTDTPDTKLEPGQFIKVTGCVPSQCIMQPYTIEENVVYLDLAREYGTTVGQIMMLSPTYNYSTSPKTGDTRPGIVLPINCTLLSSNYTSTGN